MSRTNKEFQAIVNASKTPEQIVDQYMDFIAEEMKELHDAVKSGHLPSIVKEACDVMIVCDPVVRNGTGLTNDYAYRVEEYAWRVITKITGSKCFDVAMQAVVDSNFSKFILESELDEAREHFEKLGIEVEFVQIDSGLFKAISAHNQAVMINGEPKSFNCGKTLKGPKYKPVDESVNFWEV
jgi:hypothetical protein